MLDFSAFDFQFIVDPLFYFQLIGFISMAIGWWANSQKQDCKFIHGNMIASVLTAIHLGLLGSFLGMANQLVNVIRFRLCQSLKNDDQPKLPSWLSSPLFMSVCFSAVAMAQGFLWAEHWSEWCAVIAAVVMSFSLFFLAGSQLRLAMVASNGLNLMLSIYLMSWSGILYQVMTIAILALGLMREFSDYYNDQLNQNVNEHFKQNSALASCNAAQMALSKD
ncbi:YgjV family protein [Shewanella sp. UCD-KL21]|uniref:YgjV family protein n=1 Tax=Shewanella sp. UCD-KL21 TaxID=1917164 RepID=UPI0020C9EE0E|nr:YgjV family protein [Shewanella sp. UCD-KL21]